MVAPAAPSSPAISVVVPVYNAAPMLARCLDALQQSQDVAWECIVVDDGSTDGSAKVAQEFGARVLRMSRARSGPGQARNVGARFATAPLLCFVDSDVVVQPDTLKRFVAVFHAESNVTAAFGSYDAQPEVQDLLSQYRNLLHHFVHQNGQVSASTFWAGCGAIRRETFFELGGFDPTYTRPSIEDIELGYRVRAAGGQIRLVKAIQVKHLKRWTFWGMLKTDILDRALPWTTLIARTGQLPNDLNLRTSSRASAVSVYSGLVLLGLGRWVPLARSAALLPLLVLIACNSSLYAFFLTQRGPWFLLRALPLHWLYYAYSSLAFAGGSLHSRLRTAPAFRLR